MHEKVFWDLIGWANTRGEGREEREDALEEALRSLTPPEIEDFYLLYDARVTAAWTKELKCAGYLINHHGDAMEHDMFLWFLCWLVDRGKADYYAALADPDNLEDIDEELPWGSDGYWDCAARAWEVETGAVGDAFGHRMQERGASGPVDLPRGGGVSDRYLKKYYPRLYRRFVEEAE